MKKTLCANAFFLIPYGILFVAAGCVILFSDKAELHLWLNSYHTDFWDGFFRNITKMGEWVPYATVALMLFFNISLALFVLITQLASGLCTQILKHIFNEPRPFRYFADNFPDVSLPLVDGVAVRSFFSFPSGHTTAIFAFCFAGALLTKLKCSKFLMLIGAVVASFSRIYLSQHFAIDVWIGSLVGVCMVLAISTMPFPFANKPWANKSIQYCLSKRTKAQLK